MKVLFISSGNSGDVGVLVKNQAQTLIDGGISVDHFLIIGKGFWGYLKNIKRLRKLIKLNNYDILHAHYSLSAFLATLTGSKKLVVSLMGSDAFLKPWMRVTAKIFYLFFWKCTIVKTEQMKETLKMHKAIVLPNGVDLSKFKIIDRENAKELLGIKDNKRIILFIADPSRAEKNYKLTADAYCKLNHQEVSLLVVCDKPNQLIPLYLCAGDVLILTSKWEGSVNVVKEALACNTPIVSTDVGDVKKNIEGVEGCYLCLYDEDDVAEKIKLALGFNKRTNGREKMIERGLDSETIAKKLIEIYYNILS